MPVLSRQGDESALAIHCRGQKIQLQLLLQPKPRNKENKSNASPVIHCLLLRHGRACNSR
jgi:hypothetical protein